MLAMLNARKSLRDQMLREVVQLQPSPPIRGSGRETESGDLSLVTVNSLSSPLQ